MEWSEIARFFGVISFETKLVSRYIFKRIFFEKKNGFFSFILFLQFSLLICPFCLTCSPFRLYIPLYLFPVSLLLFSFFFVFSLTSFPLCLSLLLRSFSFPSSPISNPFCLAPFILFFLFFFLLFTSALSLGPLCRLSTMETFHRFQ